MVTFLLYSLFSFFFQGVTGSQTCYSESPSRSLMALTPHNPVHPTPQKLGLQLLMDRPCPGPLQASVPLHNMSDVRSELCGEEGLAGIDRVITQAICDSKGGQARNMHGYPL